jgi:hypothetical protein
MNREWASEVAMQAMLDWRSFWNGTALDQSIQARHLRANGYFEETFAACCLQMAGLA